MWSDVNKAIKSVLACCEPCGNGTSPLSLSLFFSLEITLRSSLSPSISFDYPHAKIQIPQDTNSLSRHNYKMLYASVNSTSVTVTVCICHEMRQKQEWVCTRETGWGRKFVLCLACWLCYGRLFQPPSQMSLNVSHGICSRREHICVRASCFDRLSVSPSLFSGYKAGDITLSLLCSLFCLFVRPTEAFLHLSVLDASFLIYCKYSSCLKCIEIILNVQPALC